MTKKLEQLLNLPDPESDSEIDNKLTVQTIAEHRDIIAQVDSTIDRINAAMPGVRELDASDQELDELAGWAKEKAQDLIDLGMNIDPRFAGVIMQTAGTMLGHAITAKTAKIDRKLKTIQLQLQKAKLDHQVAKDTKQTSDSDDSIDGQGVVLDRNELLQQILNSQQSQK